MGSVELAILKAAQEGGYLDAIPEAEDEITEQANFYLKEAQEAVKDSKFKKDKTIKEIINLGEQLGKQTADVLFGDGKVDLYRGLPVPEDLHVEPTPLPADFTELSSKEIMRLHSIYNAYYARARWMLAVTTNKLANVVHLRDAEYRRAYKDIVEDAEVDSKKPTRDYIDSLARQDVAYIDYDNKVKLHSEDVTSYKALVEIYESNVDRLSREWTMRQDEEKRY